ncbi:MAG TPA: ABC-F family ATP-binding cassette domain-containing protein [Candidatus Limnocylindrales bacterium]|nr:ABC-F family ATP-binding cassette domain-containing protein [Candidatus Limnocylindrales bacterium]
MSILSAHNLSKSFGPDEIFAGVSVEIPHRARIALVGPNGAGKTTLLNILAGFDTPSEGGVTRSRNLRVGYLPQRPETASQLTLWDEQMLAFTALREDEARLARLEAQLADSAQPPEAHDRILAEYGDLQEQFEEQGGYTYEHRIRTVLHGLGFAPEEYARPIGLLSGGQKTRALLARLLLEAPGLLALDEPTNHLDIQSVEWLEGYLKDFPGAVLVVSHDRYFMDAVATTIWELDFGQLETYRGNYSAYAHQREERHARLFKEYEAQQAFIAKEEDYIRRNMAGQNTRQAQGRLKRLERLKRDDLVLRPRRHRDFGLRMAATVRSGDLVLRTRGLTVGYDYPLFSAPDLTLRRGEVAALIGPNGAGKSTFVKTIIEQIPPLAGQLVPGAAVQIGYFAQAHERLDPSQTLLDAVTSTKPMPISQARSYLGGYLFEEDDVFRPISTLSGGERGRIALALLALSGANFLILDEPTNHLDIASQEALQNVLLDFAGTILVVSHDRYLIDALATQIWNISPGRLELFEGTYSEFLAARERARLAATERAAAANGAKQTASRAPAQKRHGLTARELDQRIVASEAAIAALEARLHELTADLERASVQGDAARVRELGESYAQTETDLAAAMAEWERWVS